MNGPSRFFWTVLILLLIGSFSLVAEAFEKKMRIPRFDSIIEPSGVVQLKTGQLIVIEDNPGVLPWLVTPRLKGKDIILQEEGQLQLNTSFDDLEALAISKEGDLFFLTSHSLSKSGNQGARRKLIVVRDSHGGMEESVNDHLLDALLQLLGKGAAETINIEGMSMDSGGSRLVLGLRAPLIDGASPVLFINNVSSLTQRETIPQFSQEVSLLHIGGGIRSLCYSVHLAGYLVANEIETEKGKRVSALWFWKGPGILPERVEIKELDQVKNVEGICAFTLAGMEYILLVCDDGRFERQRGGHYIVLPLSRFGSQQEN